MNTLLLRLTRLRDDCKAVTALEYGLIAAAVVAVGLAGFSIIGDNLHSKMATVDTAMSADP